MEKTDNVSILMPTYNCVKYIDAAVLSIVAQTHQQFTLLAYDDHSNDGTFDHLKFWQGIDLRIRVRRPFSRNVGYLKLLNQMIDDTDTKYIARQDGDDISYPGRLESQLSFMKSHPNASLCGSQGGNIIDREGNRISFNYPWESQFVNPIASYDMSVNQLMRDHHRIIHGSMFSTVEAFRCVGKYDESLAPVEDWDISLKLAQIGDVYVIPRKLYLRRIHDDNVSKGHPNKANAIAIIKERYGLNCGNVLTRPSNF
jgi:glycosyltransferase involved in cell wall biosynthesis